MVTGEVLGTIAALGVVVRDAVEWCSEVCSK